MPPPQVTKTPSQAVHTFRVGLKHKAHPTLHTHDSHELYFAESGTGWQYTDAGRWAMHPGSLWIFPTGTQHIGCATEGGTCVGLVMSLREEACAGINDDAGGILNRLVATHGADNPHICLSDDNQPRVHHLFATCIEECRGMAPGFRSALRARVLDLLTICARDPLLAADLKPGLRAVSDEERIGPLLRYLGVHFREPISIDDCCRQADLSRSHLHALFKRCVGTSPGEYLARLRISEAQNLLRVSERDVLSIAMDVGYGSLSHFYQQFSRISGCSPAAWRTQNT